MKNEHSVNMTEDTRIALLEQSIGHINQTLIRMEKRLDQVELEIKSNFYWTLGGFITILGVLAHGFHWI